MKQIFYPLVPVKLIALSLGNYGCFASGQIEGQDGGGQPYSSGPDSD